MPPQRSGARRRKRPETGEIRSKSGQASPGSVPRPFGRPPRASGGSRRPRNLKIIKNLDGKVIGVHDGIINFTIGQRKGIKVSDKGALYVLKIDAEKNEIFVGPREKLGKKDIKLHDLNLLVNKNEFKNNIFVKVRSTGKLLEGKVNFNNDNTALVNLEEFEDGISPGQACVFYNKDKFGYKVLCGGWIKN